MPSKAATVKRINRPRPVVYLAKAGGAFLWHSQLPIPHDYYQGRVTHYGMLDNAVYVLVPMDID